MELKYSLVANPAGTLLSLFIGGDIEIVDFHPPPLIYMFEYTQKIPLYAVVNLVLGFRVSATLEFSLV